MHLKTNKDCVCYPKGSKCRFVCELSLNWLWATCVRDCLQAHMPDSCKNRNPTDNFGGFLKWHGYCFAVCY